MTERPILFSTPMVKAILDGTKTMTRRIMKVQPPNDGGDYQVCRILAGDRRNVGKYRWVNKNCLATRVNAPYFSLPWENGDRLWVREAFTPIPKGDTTATGVLWDIQYVADEHIQEELLAPVDYNPMLYNYYRPMPSLFMPRWASRILLEITNIRVERLQDITEEDAIAEGVCEYCSSCKALYEDDRNCEFNGYECESHGKTLKEFKVLWDSINGKKPGKGWQDNPWVWVIEFKEVK